MPAEQVYPERTGNPSRNGTAEKHPARRFDLEERLVALGSAQRTAILARALRKTRRVKDEYRGRRPPIMEAATLLSHVIYMQPKGTIRPGRAWLTPAEIEDETGLWPYAQRAARDLLGDAGLAWLSGDYDRLRHRMFYRVCCERGEFGTLVEPLLEDAENKRIERQRTSDPAKDSRKVTGHESGNLTGHESRKVTGHKSGNSTGHQSSSDVTTDETTDTTPDVIDHAPADGECGADHRGSAPSRDDGRVDEGEVSKCSSTTPPSLPKEAGKSSAEVAQRRSWPGQRRTSPGFATLPESILEEALALPAFDLSGEAASLGRQLCIDLGRPYAAEGLAVRLAEECIRRGLPEALGAVAAKASRDDVRSPDGYLRKYIVGEINECKDHMQTGGDPVARFRAARDGELTRLIAASTVRGGSAGSSGGGGPVRDAQGRASLAGRSASPTYGVRDPSVERAPEDYFQRGGSKGHRPR